MKFFNKKKQKGEEDDHSFERSDHSSVIDGDPYTWKTAHNRLLTQYKISISLILILGFCLVGSVNAISYLVPLKTVEYRFIDANPLDDVQITSHPISEDQPGFKLYMEDTAIKYVQNILEIDKLSQGKRMREIAKVTDARYLKKFKEEFIDSKVIHEALANGLNRSITAESAVMYEEINGVYRYSVDFIQHDYREGELIEEKPGRAFLAMTTMEKQVKLGERYKNTLGVYVLDMVVKKRTAQSNTGK